MRFIEQLGVLPDGTCEVLWIDQTEGAKFWLKVFNELRSRSVNDISSPSSTG